MKRKFIKIPKQLHHYTKVIDDLEQLVKHLKTKKDEIVSSPFRESIVSLIWTETQNTNPHLMIPIDILKRIFMFLTPQFAIKTIRLLNKAFYNWVNHVTDHYTIDWIELNRSHIDDFCSQHYAVWSNTPKPFDLVWTKELDLKFWRIRKQSAGFNITKNGQPLYDKMYVAQKSRWDNMTEYNLLHFKHLVQITWISDSKTKKYDTQDAFNNNNFYSMVVHIN